MSESVLEGIGYMVIYAMLWLLGGLVGAVIPAAILQWRGRKLETWSINFGDAYMVAAGASIAANLISWAIMYFFSLFGHASTQDLNSIGFLVGVASWLIAFTYGLLKISSSYHPLSSDSARALTIDVSLTSGCSFLIMVGLISAVLALVNAGT